MTRVRVDTVSLAEATGEDLWGWHVDAPAAGQEGAGATPSTWPVGHWGAGCLSPPLS